MWNCICVTALLVVVCTARAELSDNPTFVVTPKDAVRAKVVFDKRSETLLEVVLTLRKAKDFTAFTKANRLKTVDIAIGGEVVYTAKIMLEITTGLVEVPVKSEADAIRLARYLAERETPSPNKAMDSNKE